MTRKTIKATLMQHGLRIWQLCKMLGISRNTYYHYSHNNFKGHQTEIKRTIKKLISKAGANL